jgi:hypothetical protein
MYKKNFYVPNHFFLFIKTFYWIEENLQKEIWYRLISILLKAIVLKYFDHLYWQSLNFYLYSIYISDIFLSFYILRVSIFHFC